MEYAGGIDVALRVDPVLSDAPRTMRVCPRCGGRGYTATTGLDKEAEMITAETICCNACGFDILERYREIKSRPPIVAWFARFFSKK